MIITINDKCEVRLEEPLDNRKFHVEIQFRSLSLQSLATAFSPYGLFESREHAWVDIAALQKWQGFADNAPFQLGLEAMLGYAAKKGWLSPDGNRVRAHVVWCSVDRIEK